MAFTPESSRLISSLQSEAQSAIEVESFAAEVYIQVGQHSEHPYTPADLLARAAVAARLAHEAAAEDKDFAISLLGVSEFYDRAFVNEFGLLEVMGLQRQPSDIPGGH